MLSPTLITILMIVSMITFVMLGYPVAFVLGGIATVAGVLFVGPTTTMNLFMFRAYGTMADYLLVAVPLFVFMGVVIERSGLAGRLYDAMYVLMGRLHGGLAVATVVTCTIFAAATGVIGASVVTMGLLAVPAMMRYNYNKPLAAGSVCAGGTLGVLIPPSVIIIIYGQAAGISVGPLFMGAFVPGLLLAALYVLYIIIRCRINPELGPALPPEAVQASLGRKVWLFITSVLPVGALVMAVLGSIFFGVAAPTEAAGIGALASLILAAAYRQLSRQNLKEAVFSTIKISAMVYMLLLGAGFFSVVFVRLGGARMARELLLNLPFQELGITISMLVLIFIMGMFLDPMATVMIIAPIITPIAQTLGHNPVWFAMLVIVTMQTAFLSPPFAMSIFYLKGIAPPEMRTKHIYRGVMPFLGIQALAILILMVFPQLVTWLPDLMRR